MFEAMAMEIEQLLAQVSKDDKTKNCFAHLLAVAAVTV